MKEGVTLKELAKAANELLDKMNEVLDPDESNKLMLTAELRHLIFLLTLLEDEEEEELWDFI